MLKKLITVAGLAGTLGVAAPAFADWYQPAPAPDYQTPVQQQPYYVSDRDDWRRGDEWRRDDEWRRHEAWERYRRWRRWEWMRHHRGGDYYGGGYYQGW